MGVHRYKKPEATDVQGICVACNKNKQKSVKQGTRFLAICSSCDKKRTPASIAGDRKHHTKRLERVRQYKANPKPELRKTCCERCGFIPEAMCQLDLDHIDGNHNNDDPSNHQTLCANCHRLKTYLNKDWKPRTVRVFFMGIKRNVTGLPT